MSPSGTKLTLSEDVVWTAFGPLGDVCPLRNQGPFGKLQLVSGRFVFQT